jgi:hypothetical protein
MVANIKSPVAMREPSTQDIPVDPERTSASREPLTRCVRPGWALSGLPDLLTHRRLRLIQLVRFHFEKQTPNLAPGSQPFFFC